MSELKTVAKQLKEISKTANLDLESGNSSTRPGREMLRNQAREQLETVKAQYKEALNKSVVTIFVNGTNAATFAKLASDAGALTVDGNEFYAKIATQVEPSLGANKIFGITQLGIITRELRLWAQATQTKEFQSPKLLNDRQTTDFTQVVEFVKEAIEGSNGVNLLKRDLEERVLNLALEEETESKVVPVVVLNTNPTEQNSLTGTLFRGKGLILDTDKSEVNEELVTKTFEQIKKLLKG